MKYRSPRGTHDILPDQAGSFRKIFEISRVLFERSGYREINTPMFEETELFARSVGAETDIVQKEMYVFKDRGGRNFALRPEGTAAVIRAYLQHGLHGKLDIQKLYYMGPMFRYDRPAAGRYRQFHQVGIEAVGNISPFLDVECISILRNLASHLGISDTEIRLNSVGCRKCRPAYILTLKDFLSPNLDAMCSDCNTRYVSNPLRVLDCKKEGCRESLSGTPEIQDHLCEECSPHFDDVKDIMDSNNIPYTLDPFLVRGLDYYTKTAFELFDRSLGPQSSLGGGGRYDDLVEILGGSPTPAVGFSAGIERLVLVTEAREKEAAEKSGVKTRERLVDVFLISTDDETKKAAFEAMLGLRNSFRVDMDVTGKSVKAQFRKADKAGARVVVIFGSEEMKSGSVKVKDMENGDEVLVPIDGIGDFINKSKDV